MPLFGKLHPVIRKGQGSYVEGRWVEAPEGAPSFVLLSVQPASDADREMVEGDPGGQRLSGLLRAYGGTAAPLKEGDVLLYDGARWRVVSAPPARDALGPDVAHVRYILTREIEPG